MEGALPGQGADGARETFQWNLVALGHARKTDYPDTVAFIPHWLVSFVERKISVV
jgi:hypothetical protein